MTQLSSNEEQEDASGEARRRPAVLVVGADDWAVDQTMRTLRSGGVDTLSCHERGEPALPCNALLKGRRCPLDVGIDAVVCVRSGSPHASLGEIGSICALRDHRPLILAGLATEHPLEPWADHVVAPDGDVVSACQAVADRSGS